MRPPMAQRALCRPLATSPCMAILALIMAINEVMPYGSKGLALERMGARRALSWGLVKYRSCLEALMKVLKRRLNLGSIWPS